MARFCAKCGTEVEESAVFCPTCGQPIQPEVEAEIPPAPDWPDQALADRQPPASEQARTRAGDPRSEEPTRAEQAPPTAADRPPDRAVPPPAAGRPGPAPAPVSLPITMPVMLSAWLIGGGAVLAALGVLIGLFGGFLNPIDLILLVALIGIAATVFFSGSVPHIPHLRLITLVTVLIGFGMALDRIGFGSAGVGDLLLLLGTAAAAIGAILLELGRDQPLGGPQF